MSQQLYTLMSGCWLPRIQSNAFFFVCVWNGKLSLPHCWNRNSFLECRWGYSIISLKMGSFLGHWFLLCLFSLSFFHLQWKVVSHSCLRMKLSFPICQHFLLQTVNLPNVAGRYSWFCLGIFLKFVFMFVLLCFQTKRSYYQGPLPVSAKCFQTSYNWNRLQGINILKHEKNGLHRMSS